MVTTKISGNQNLKTASFARWIEYYQNKIFCSSPIGCKPDPFKTPVTFKNSKSFVRLPGYTEGSENLDVSLEFRFVFISFLKLGTYVFPFDVFSVKS